LKFYIVIPKSIGARVMQKSLRRQYLNMG